MRHRRNTLLHGTGCPCSDCCLSRLVFAVAMLVLAAAGAAWLYFGAP